MTPTAPTETHEKKVKFNLSSATIPHARKRKNNTNRNEPFAWEFDVKSMYVLRFNSFSCCFFFSFHLQKVTVKTEAYYL